VRSSRRPAVALGLAALVVAVAASAAPVGAAPSQVDFAFIGDTQYGPTAFAQFPQLVSQIDGDPTVQFVAHAGDIKSGSTLCSDQLLNDTFAQYQAFDDPFWYTPGDNEWTDCHRTNNGGYLPTERLDRIRQLFFPVPGQTTGGTTMPVTTQSSNPAFTTYVENTTFQKECVTFGAVHVVGSNDNGSTWNQYPGNPGLGLPAGDQLAMRTAEFTARRLAAVAWIDKIFDDAIANNSEGVFLMMQAQPVAANASFADVRNKIIARATAFGKPVILGHGDTHVYSSTPAWAGVSNITRLEVPGEATAIDRWLKVSAACGSNSTSVFSWELKTFGILPPAEIPEGPIVVGVLTSALAAAFVMRRRQRQIASSAALAS
jgi:hypothetical protein